MTKIKLVLITAAMIAVLPVSAMAADATGSCGVGSLLFKGQKGVAPQVLAMTTNGYSSQTIAVTLGTSGCSQDGVVASNWKTAVYIDGNKSKLAMDMSKGSGEALESLAQLIGVKDADKAAFYQATKENFAKIFVGEQASAEQITLGLKQVLAANSTLAQYTAAI
jgi:Protein of unknown function (DUF3015)